LNHSKVLLSKLQNSALDRFVKLGTILKEIRGKWITFDDFRSNICALRRGGGIKCFMELDQMDFDQIKV
jgi:hypothetical protein